MTETILNSFDIWTDARAEKHRGRVRSIANISLEGIAHLRELILELAVRGKLVPQNPEDVPVSKHIVAPPSRVTPFTLPKGWLWYYMGDIGITNVGLTYKPSEINNDGTPVLRSSNIQNGKLSFDDLVRVGTKYRDKDVVENGDLLICARNGSQALVGKCAIIEGIREKMTFGAFMAIFKSKFNPFVKVFMDSPIYRSRLEGVSTTTINQITQSNLKSTLIPLPPLEEQKRIVAKVDELMALCDRLEDVQTSNLQTHDDLVKALLAALVQATDAAAVQAAWQQMLPHFDVLFTTEDSIEQLKQTILQLAVMGRLVPQNHEDEPASKLLQKIAAEKKKLIEAGKIKKEKPLPAITEKEKPFALPKGWEWVRFGNAVFNRDSERIPLSVDERATIQGEFDYYGASGIIDTINKFLFDKPLLLIGEDGANLINRTTPIAFIARGRYWVNNHAHVIDGISESLLEYVCLHINAISLKPYVTGTAQPKMNQAKMNSILLALPPLEEQKRIVAKVDELFAICDALKERITAAEALKNHLSATIIQQAMV